MEIAGVEFIQEEGMFGLFTRHQDDGAIENGRRIFKTNSMEGDATPDGTPGTVLGSVAVDVDGVRQFFYFVEWADKPRYAVGAMGFKITEEEPG